MNPMAKTEVTIGSASNIKGAGMGKLRLVQIGCCKHYSHQISGLDRHAGYHSIPGGDTPEHVHRRAIAQHLLYRSRQEIGLGKKLLSGRRVLIETEDSIADEAGGGLIARQHQQGTGSQHIAF